MLTHLITPLENFESKYDRLQQEYTGNYAWYQFTLAQRVIEIYLQRGSGYLLEIQMKFTAGATKLETAQMLNELERFSPGWKAWAAQVDAGNVQPALSPAT